MPISASFPRSISPVFTRTSPSWSASRFHPSPDGRGPLVPGLPYILPRVGSYHPHRASDLMRYHLLILRMASQYPGMTWFNHDDAFFRRNAAARSITDWSNIHLELFAFYTFTPSTTSTPVPSTPSGPADIKSSGSPSSRFTCHSWNSGRFSACISLCTCLR